MHQLRMKHRRKMPDLEIRRAALVKLGFRTYRDYLASPLWQRIRARVLARNGGRCAFCGDRATQVHHRSYTLQVLKGQKLGSLVQCCRPCHKEIEFWPDGQKREPHEVKRRSRELEGAYQKRQEKRRQNDSLTQEFRAIVREGGTMDRTWADELSKGGAR